MELDITALLHEAERGPSSEELATAPHIDNWWIERIGDWLRAQGDLTGHPTISDPFVTTSPIISINPDAGWLRMRSRFYRLGQPLALAPNLRLVDAISIDEAQRLLAGIRREIRDDMDGFAQLDRGEYVDFDDVIETAKLIVREKEK